MHPDLSKDMPDLHQRRYDTEYLLARFKPIDLKIQQILKMTEQVFARNDNYRGLYITGEEVRALLEKPIGAPWWSVLPANYDCSRNDAYRKSCLKEITQIENDASADGIILRLQNLCSQFQLDTVELDILLLALAQYIDTRYDMLFAYLQDNITRKFPGTELVANLFCDTALEKIEFQKYLSSGSSLVRNKLVHIIDFADKKIHDFPGKALKGDNRIFEYLLGSDVPDEMIRDLVVCIEPTDQDRHGNMPQDIEHSIAQLAHKFINNASEAFVFIQLPLESEVDDIPAIFAKALQRKMLVINCRDIANFQDSQLREQLRYIGREIRLLDACLYLKGLDALRSDERELQYNILLKLLQENNGIVFFEGSKAWQPYGLAAKRVFFHYRYPTLSYAQRLEAWFKTRENHALSLTDHELDELSARFAYTHGQINNVARLAKNNILSLEQENSPVDLKQIYKASHSFTSNKLSCLAKKITPKYTWDDIILVDDKFHHLREMYNMIRHQNLIYEIWGFNDKLSIGKGVNALFCGPPGTGKTMAAEVVANALGLELFKIDLSLVVSKYIGETEKNLSRIFAEAETTNVILFFDEADSLFGRRTDIKDSHDRYANVEVAYLLQKIEEYSGVTILATNFRKNLDEAFIRRLAFVLEFPLPNETERKRIWQSIWPQNVPLAKDIDFNFMSSQFKLAGGNIKNISLAAAFLAAEDGGEVEMKHLLLSTKRELEKQGRVFVRDDYGKYSKLLP